MVVLRSNRSISSLPFQVLSQEVSFSVPLRVLLPSLQLSRAYTVSAPSLSSIDIDRYVYKAIVVYLLIAIDIWLPKHNLWLRREE